MAKDPEFHKIRRLPPYVFAEVNALKAKARAAGEDVIDFGMGNPDQPPPEHITAKLTETLNDPRVHRYSTSRGIPGLRRAISSSKSCGERLISGGQPSITAPTHFP